MTAPVNIVFACDQGYLQHLSVALLSLLDNNRDLAMNIHIVNSDIDKPGWDILVKLNAGYGQKLINLKLSDSHLGGIAATGHYNKSNYYKLHIPDLLPGEKALYLDSDIVVAGSILPIWATELGNSCLAAVENPGFSRHRKLGMKPESKYFNSGVMLLNLETWRRDRLAEKTIAFTRAYPEAIVLAEQCGLNAVVDGRWIQLHPKFNFQTYYFENPPGEKNLSDELREAMKHPVIIHYTALPKPWMFACRYPYKSIYWKYLRRTPFRWYIPPDLNLRNVVKRVMGR